MAMAAEERKGTPSQKMVDKGCNLLARDGRLTFGMMVTKANVNKKSTGT